MRFPIDRFSNQAFKQDEFNLWKLAREKVGDSPYTKTQLRE
jgi:hypothetical protein